MKRLILSVSILAAIAGCSRASSTPAGVVEDFMRKMESGNCSGIGDALSASSKSVAGPKLEQACAAAGEMRKADPKAKTISSIKVLESTENGDRATVRLEATYSDGTKDGGEPITVVRENGAWKIDLMATGMGGGGGMGGGPTPTPPMTPPATTPTAPTMTPGTPAAPSATPTPAEAPDAEEAPEPADAEK
jgi:hypothetical protein